jgi:hypothetical protein
LRARLTVRRPPKAADLDEARAKCERSLNSV